MEATFDESSFPLKAKPEAKAAQPDAAPLIIPVSTTFMTPHDTPVLTTVENLIAVENNITEDSAQGPGSASEHPNESRQEPKPEIEAPVIVVDEADEAKRDIDDPTAEQLDADTSLVEIDAVPNIMPVDNRHTKRIRSKPDRYMFLKEDEESRRQMKRHRVYVLTAEPESITEALEDDGWRTAMENEYQSLVKNHTWDLVKPPTGKRVIQGKWVFKVKTGADGTEVRKKARFVARGFTQKKGIDYQQTYSPVISMTSFRLMLTIAAFHDLEIVQMDIDTAYLYGELSEEIYIQQPEGFRKKDKNGVELVCRLQTFLLGLGFQSNSSEPCLYCQHTKNGPFMVAVYVDDLVVAAPTPGHIDYIFTAVLGIQVIRNRGERKIFLSQATYAWSILKRFGMEDANPVKTPTEDRASTLDAEEADATYPLPATWPGTRISRDKVISSALSASSDILEAYADADYEADKATRRSVSGTLIKFGGGAIAWASRLQSCVTLSTVEAEYVALCSATQEIVWLRCLLGALGCRQASPTPVSEDNQGTIALAESIQTSRRSKHIHVRFHFVREKVYSKDIVLKHVPSHLQLADIFTKPLMATAFQRLRDQIVTSGPPTGGGVGDMSGPAASRH